MSSSSFIGPLMPTYMRLPIAFERGEGVWLYDEDGNRYLDALSGIGVCSLGHSHPEVTKAIQYQAAKLIHTSNVYQIPLQQQLGKALCDVSGMEAVFFGNSGAEANEAAIKIARLYGHGKNIDLPKIIVMEGSFHGRTLATLSATANKKVQAGFEPLVEGFIRVPYNDVDAVKKVAAEQEGVVAILVEPVQGEGGINVPSDDYLNQLRTLCDEQDWLLMLDEVQSGNGRTGKYFAYQNNGIVPDVVTTAKGLGNGMPIGACLAQGKAASVFKPGNHGSTYGGNPLACATALAVVNTITNEGLADHAAQMGKRIAEQFQLKLSGANYIKEIRHKGLMIGIELNMPCGELVQLAQMKGLLINVTAERVIRLLPPLIISEEECDILVDGLAKLVKAYAGDDRQQPRS